MPSTDPPSRLLRLVIIAGVGVALLGAAAWGLVLWALSPPDTSSAKAAAEAQARTRQEAFVAQLAALDRRKLTDQRIVQVGDQYTVFVFTVARTSAGLTLTTQVDQHYADTSLALCFRSLITLAGASTTESADTRVSDLTPCPTTEPMVASPTPG